MDQFHQTDEQIGHHLPTGEIMQAETRPWSRR
jgi:hypothetical protein